MDQSIYGLCDVAHALIRLPLFGIHTNLPAARYRGHSSYIYSVSYSALSSELAKGSSAPTVLANA